MAIAGVRWLELGKFDDARGKLRFGEFDTHLPFVMRRFYFMTDVPAEALRAGVCHLEMEQAMIAVKGAFTCVVDNGKKREEYRVDDSGEALYVPPMVWREVKDFSADAVCLVVASLPYDATEQVKIYDEFLKVLAQ